VSEFVSSPRPAEDAFTRLWHRADASQAQYAEAIAELRERSRQEHDARPLGRRRWRRDGREVSNRALLPRQRRTGPVAGKRVECERCGRAVERSRSEWVAISSSVGDPAEHLLCPRCGDEVRRGLLRLLEGKVPLPARYEEEQDVPPTLVARAGWFLFRMGAYGLIMLAVFGVVALISTR
jgi:hypothetical protein